MNTHKTKITHNLLLSKNHKPKTKNYFGFTLVELIVVIVILAILATIAFLSFGSQSAGARNSTRAADINNITKAAEMFYIKSGSYPLPDNSFTVTYSGGIVWYQGVISDSFTKRVGTISKKVVDPLTSEEYDYSTLAYGSSYQIKADYEGDVTTYNNINDIANIFQLNNNVYAASGSTTAYIKGNYMGTVAKTKVGTTIYILAIPSLISSLTTTADIYNDTLSGTLILNGKSSTTGVSYNPNKVVFSGATIPTNDTASGITNMMNNIVSAYAGTEVATYSPSVKEIVNTPTSQLASLGSNMISNQLGSSASAPSGTGNNGGGAGVLINSGATSSTPGLNCTEIKSNYSNVGSGTYWIDPDGAGGASSFQVYCDMTTDGGGWTVIFNTQASSTAYPAEGTITNLTTDNYYLSSDKVQSLAYLSTKIRIQRRGTNDYVETKDGDNFSMFKIRNLEMLNDDSTRNGVHFQGTMTDSLNYSCGYTQETWPSLYTASCNGWGLDIRKAPSSTSTFVWNNSHENIVVMLKGNSLGKNTGSSQTFPGLSCNEIKSNYSNVGSGTYWIDPDGAGGASSFQVYCDMSTGGGGRTVIFNTQTGSTGTFPTVGVITNLDTDNIFLTGSKVQAIANISNKIRIQRRGTNDYVETKDGDSYTIDKIKNLEMLNDETTKDSSHFQGTILSKITYSCDSSLESWPSLYTSSCNGSNLDIRKAPNNKASFYGSHKFENLYVLLK